MVSLLALPRAAQAVLQRTGADCNPWTSSADTRKTFFYGQGGRGWWGLLLCLQCVKGTNPPHQVQLGPCWRHVAWDRVKANSGVWSSLGGSVFCGSVVPVQGVWLHAYLGQHVGVLRLPNLPRDSFLHPRPGGPRKGMILHLCPCGGNVVGMLRAHWAHWQDQVLHRMQRQPKLSPKALPEKELVVLLLSRGNQAWWVLGSALHLAPHHQHLASDMLVWQRWQGWQPAGLCQVSAPLCGTGHTWTPTWCLLLCMVEQICRRVEVGPVSRHLLAAGEGILQGYWRYVFESPQGEERV